MFLIDMPNLKEIKPREGYLYVIQTFLTLYDPNY